MSKKKNVVVEETANQETKSTESTVVETPVTEETKPVETPTTPEAKEPDSLQFLMNKYPHVSLRKIVLTLGGTYNLALKASKKPVAGVPYDPDNFNYVEVELYLIRKFDKDWQFKLDWPTLDLEKVATIHEDIEIGMDNLVTLRTSELIFNVIFKTPTHIVINPIDPEKSTQPRVMTIDTFIHQGGKVIKPEDVDKVPEQRQPRAPKSTESSVEA